MRLGCESGVAGPADEGLHAGPVVFMVLRAAHGEHEDGAVDEHEPGLVRPQCARWCSRCGSFADACHLAENVAVERAGVFDGPAVQPGQVPAAGSAKPGPQGRGRTAQLHGDAVVAAPGGPGHQRRAGHLDGVSAPGQAPRWKEHLRGPTRHAPGPAGTQRPASCRRAGVPAAGWPRTTSAGGRRSAGRRGHRGSGLPRPGRRPTP